MRSSFLHLFTLVLVAVLAFTMEVRFDNVSTYTHDSISVNIGNVAYAATPDCTKNPPDPGCANAPQESVWIKNAVDALNAILGFMTFLITPLIALAGWLLSPDWTRGDLFGLNVGLYSIWKLISNITYFLYALGLIGIALATIFNQENYAYKTMLPKLALGIIMVPFTWWIVSFVTSLGSILATSVMQIPMESLQVIKPTNGQGWYESPSIPRVVTYNAMVSTGELSTSVKKGERCTSESCLSPRQLLTRASSGPYSMLTVYAYSIFRIQDYKNIEGIAANMKVLLAIFNKLIFGAIIYLIFGLLIFALVFALLARAFELWIVTMFSPLLTLSLVLPESMRSSSIWKEHLSFGNLISLSMIPVYVSAALSFGLLFLGLILQDPPNQGESNTATYTVVKNIMGDSSNSIVSQIFPEDDVPSMLTSINIGEFTITHLGKIDPGAVQAIGGVFGNGSIIGTVILDIIALTLLWLAVMAALGASKVTKAAIEPFENAGKSIGKLGSSLPKYVPIPGTGVSAKSIEKLGQTVQYKSEEGLKKNEETKLGARFPGLFDNTVNTDQRSKLDAALRRGEETNNPLGKQNALREFLAGMGDIANTGVKSTTQIKDRMDNMKSLIGDEGAFEKQLRELNYKDEEIGKLKKLFYSKANATEEAEIMKLLGAKATNSNANSNTGAQQGVGSIEGNEIKDSVLKKQGIKMELTLVTQEGKLTVYTKEDKKIHEFDKELPDFIALFKGRAATPEALKEMIDAQLKSYVHPDDIKKIKDKLSEVPDILKKADSTDPSKTNAAPGAKK